MFQLRRASQMCSRKSPTKSALLTLLATLLLQLLLTNPCQCYYVKSSAEITTNSSATIDNSSIANDSNFIIDESLQNENHTDDESNKAKEFRSATQNNEDAAKLQEQEEEIRLEYIKDQILQRLGMNKPPKFRRKNFDIETYLNLIEVQQFERQEQSPVKDENDVDKYSEDNTSTDDSDKLFLFPTKSTSYSSVFNLTMNSMSNQLIKKVTLFIKQESDAFELEDNEVTAIATSNSTHDGMNMKVLGILRPLVKENINDLYSQPNMVDTSTLRWYQYDATHVIRSNLDEMNEDGNQQNQFMRFDSHASKLHSSFLTIEFSNGNIARSRRSVDCSEIGNSSSCCRESFYVNFTHVGWDNWILQPLGYHANYCRGACDISHARYHHTTVVQKYPSISMCCSPRQMSHLSLIYVDDSGSVFQKNLPNMIVESCDCA